MGIYIIIYGHLYYYIWAPTAIYMDLYNDNTHHRGPIPSVVGICIMYVFQTVILPSMTSCIRKETCLYAS